ncbi:hypothetical protein ALI144C_08330 [Actinosynnema sp. ALI-1.44]|uniref:ABC transporter substrate-binding protein n=1 Tax=Actinosynnema sp. ALI-1.44 TaxID=1933779 RepID=UPI00097C4506|nr:ABC transporter substrate-binding protein [Actinosynnema sp. ALI-1.44]ONI87930.1 hypothetical protein ALI144C_08330 [Actinosynnema sp. ALI-1.44]
MPQESLLVLVREFMERPEHRGVPVTRRTPMLVFTGPKGSGKTALLDEVRQQLVGTVPHAVIDCATLKSNAAWEVLASLTFDLNLTAAGYGTVPFPRFVTAQVAIAQDFTGLTTGKKQEQLERALEQMRNVDKLREIIGVMADQAAQFVPVIGPAARYAPELVLGGLKANRWSQQVVLGTGLTHYGKDKSTAYLQLIRINQLTRRDASENQRKTATELLWSAFLADLRAAFGSGSRKRRWSLNCVLLLDNIDAKQGRILYRALTDTRRNAEPDPLTVVATSGGRLPRHLDPKERIPFAEEASYANYLEQRQGEYRADSYPVRLRDLSLDEVTGMLDDVAPPWMDERRTFAAWIYRMTLGHPAATAVLVKAFSDRESRPGSLREVLADEFPGSVDQDEQITVRQRLRRKFLGDDPAEELLTQLRACAAARDLDQAELLRDSGLIAKPADNAALVPAELQVVEGDKRVMLPAFRNLMLAELAEQRERWLAVHTWLRDNGKEDRHYHALAARDVAAVVGWLEHGLSDAKTWLESLHSITEAPNDLKLDHDSTKPDRALAAAGWQPSDTGSRTTARIVAALWIARDPLTTTKRKDLYSSAAFDLRTLAQDPKAARNELRHEADVLDERAETIDDVPETASRNTVARTPPAPSMVPPVSTVERRRRRRVKVVAAVAVVAVLAVAGIFAVTEFLTCGDDVYKRHGECVGVAHSSYVFDDRIADVQRKIYAENDKIANEPRVTVAVMTPMTPLPQDAGSVTWERVRAQLEGAHVAQLAANQQGRLPKVRLVLANPGSSQQGWRDVVDQLTSAEDDLVGVVGIGLSTVPTQEAAKALAAADIPMVASVVTATDINVDKQGDKSGYIRGFIRVNTTTGDQIEVLSTFLAGSGVRTAMLVYDTNDQDLYTSTLYREFKQAATDRRGPQITVESRFDTEAALDTQFKEIAKDLCVDGAPTTILYAGRAVLLDDLIRNLRTRGCALDRQITLVTGSDASMLRSRGDLRPKDNEAKLAILYTPHFDPDAMRDDAGFVAIGKEFDRLGFDRRDLDDGWGIMMHDAMLATTESIGQAASGLDAGATVTRKEVRAALGRLDRKKNAVNGAGGTFGINATTGNSTGRRLPVIEVGPDGAFTVRNVVDLPS